MKVFVTAISIQILHLESEGIDPIKKILNINNQIIKIRRKLDAAWAKSERRTVE